MEDKRYSDYLTEKGFFVDWCDYVDEEIERIKKAKEYVEQLTLGV